MSQTVKIICPSDKHKVRVLKFPVSTSGVVSYLRSNDVIEVYPQLIRGYYKLINNQARVITLSRN